MMQMNYKTGRNETIMGLIRRPQEAFSMYIEDFWEDFVREPYIYENKEDGALAFQGDYDYDCKSSTKENVNSLSMLIFDIDKGDTEEHLKFFENYFDKCYYFWFTSFNSSPELRKYRFCVPLLESLDKVWVMERWKIIYEWKIKEFGLGVLDDGTPFGRCDFSEAIRYGGSFIPGHRKDSEYLYKINDWDPLYDFKNVIEKFYEKYVESLPEKEKHKFEGEYIKEDYVGDNSEIEDVYDWIEHCKERGNTTIEEFFDYCDVDIDGRFINYKGGNNRHGVLFSVLRSAICLDLNQEIFDEIRDNVLKYESLSYYEKQLREAMKHGKPKKIYKINKTEEVVKTTSTINEPAFFKIRLQYKTYIFD